MSNSDMYVPVVLDAGEMLHSQSLTKQFSILMQPGAAVKLPSQSVQRAVNPKLFHPAGVICALRWLYWFECNSSIVTKLLQFRHWRQTLVRLCSVTLCWSWLDERNVPTVSVPKRDVEKEEGKRIIHVMESGWELAAFDVWSQQPRVSC